MCVFRYKGSFPYFIKVLEKITYFLSIFLKSANVIAIFLLYVTSSVGGLRRTVMSVILPLEINLGGSFSGCDLVFVSTVSSILSCISGAGAAALLSFANRAPDFLLCMPPVFFLGLSFVLLSVLQILIFGGCLVIKCLVILMKMPYELVYSFFLKDFIYS